MRLAVHAVAAPGGVGVPDAVVPVRNPLRLNRSSLISVQCALSRGLRSTPCGSVGCASARLVCYFARAVRSASSRPTARGTRQAGAAHLGLGSATQTARLRSALTAPGVGPPGHGTCFSSFEDCSRSRARCGFAIVRLTPLREERHSFSRSDGGAYPIVGASPCGSTAFFVAI